MSTADRKLLAALARAEVLLEGLEPGSSQHGVLTELISQARQGKRQLDRLIRRSDATEEKLFDTNRKLEIITQSLSRFVPQTVADALMRGDVDQVARIERRHLTVFFSDIVGFSQIATREEPEPLAALLMDYFSAMTDICNRHGGTLDQFIGDAVVIFFGDPESRGAHQDALAAVTMAIEMQQKLEELRHGWHADGLNQDIHARMGISTGYCHVGNFGSTSRLHYTAIGNTVNEAARIQALADPDSVVISADTWLLVKDAVACQPLGARTLKGRDHPVELYQADSLIADSDSTMIKLSGEGYRVFIDSAELGNPRELISALENTLSKLKT